MNKLTKKIIFSIIIILFIVFFVLVTPNIDIKYDWLVITSFLFLIGFLLSAVINFKKTVLSLLFILPTVMAFHEYKINIGKFFSSIKFVDMPLNTTALISLLIIFLGIIAIINNKNKLKKIPLKYVISFYLIYSLISFFWSESLNESLIGLIYVTTPFFAYFLFYSISEKKEDLLNLIKTLILSSIPVILYCFYQILTKTYFFEPDSSLGRITGPFVHPNLLGLYLFTILSLSFTLYFSYKNKKIKDNKTFAILIIILSIIFVLTYSRVSWLCFSIFILLIAFIQKQIYYLIAIMTPIIILSSIFIENIRMRIAETFENSLFNSWTARTNIWKISINEISKRPILGHGVGTSEIVIEEAKTWEGGTSITHNDFFLHAIEIGMIGVTLFCVYIISTIYNLTKIYKTIPNNYTQLKNNEINFKIITFGITAIFISIIIASFFESASREIVAQIFLWSVIGAVFSTQKNQK